MHVNSFELRVALLKCVVCELHLFFLFSIVSSAEKLPNLVKKIVFSSRHNISSRHKTVKVRKSALKVDILSCEIRFAPMCFNPCG